MNNPDIQQAMDVIVQLTEQSEVAAQTFSETIFALINIPDDELQSYTETLILELAAMDTEVEYKETPEWVFVNDRVIAALRVTTALFERAQAEARSIA